MPRHIHPAVHCRREAAECGRKALKATLAEVREAYVNLEHGWLRLAPETSDNQESSAEAGPGRRIASAPGLTRSHSARPGS
jgi:hypothetical protein